MFISFFDPDRGQKRRVKTLGFSSFTYMKLTYQMPRTLLKVFGGGGGGWWWLRVSIVFTFGPKPQLV